MKSIKNLYKYEIIRNNVHSAIRQWAYLYNLKLPTARRMEMVFKGQCCDDVGGHGLGAGTRTGKGRNCNEWKIFKDVIPFQFKDKSTPNRNIVLQLKKEVEQEIEDGDGVRIPQEFMNQADSRNVFVSMDKDGNDIIPRLKEHDFIFNRLDEGFLTSNKLCDANVRIHHLNEISKSLFDGRYISKIGADLFSDLRETLELLDPVSTVFLLEEYAFRQYATWRNETFPEYETDQTVYLTQTSDLDMLITLAPWKNVLPPFTLGWRGEQDSWWDWLVEDGDLYNLHLNVPSSQEPFKLSVKGFRQVQSYYFYHLLNHHTTTKNSYLTWEFGHEYAGQPMTWTTICKTTMNWWKNPNVYELRVQTAESQQEQETTPNALRQNK